MRERLPLLRRLVRARGLLCRVRLPGGVDGLVRELALVASPAPPYLRRLTVYGRTGRDPFDPDPPRAA